MKNKKEWKSPELQKVNIENTMTDSNFGTDFGTFS